MFFFFLPFRNYTKRKTAFRRKLWRKWYFWYARAMIWFFKKRYFSYQDSEHSTFYLSPTNESTNRLKELEENTESIYLNSWLFRNPVGINKYRKEIQAYFSPRKNIETFVSLQVEKWRKQNKTLIGVHIRQGDYLTWRKGAYYIEQARVREIIDEYLSFFKKNKDEILFVITSDGTVDEKLFYGLSFVVSKSNAVTDLFLLSSTDTIIGSDSTFGAFASYYGNLPFIVMQKNAMDWEYYQDKKEYFENKHCTVVHY